MVGIILYHGSDHVISVPEYGKGNVRNDFGPGFYCTRDRSLAMEWACRKNSDGFTNQYALDTDGLEVLDLRGMNVLNWLAVLLEFRTLEVPVGLSRSIDRVREMFGMDISGYDIIIGHRADDSYFSFVSDFMNNAIPVSILRQAMELGGLGDQHVVRSRRAFEALEYLGSEQADAYEWSCRCSERNRGARIGYYKIRDEYEVTRDDVFLNDIVTGEVTADDPRISRDGSVRCQAEDSGSFRLCYDRSRHGCRRVREAAFGQLLLVPSGRGVHLGGYRSLRVRPHVRADGGRSGRGPQEGIPHGGLLAGIRPGIHPVVLLQILRGNPGVHAVLRDPGYVPGVSRVRYHDDFGGSGEEADPGESDRIEEEGPRSEPIRSGEAGWDDSALLAHVREGGDGHREHVLQDAVHPIEGAGMQHGGHPEGMPPVGHQGPIPPYPEPWFPVP